MKYTNSPLVDCTVYSPNHSGERTYSIERITPHCVVGQLAAERIGDCFRVGRNASCNYGIGFDGRVCLVVDEANRSWCSSSNANDQRAVTIECASDNKYPYKFTQACYDKLVELCVDICRRNGKSKLLWFNDRDKTLSYVPSKDEMVLTVHRWFANKSCPGDWLFSRMGDLAKRVTECLVEETKPEEEIIYRVQVGAFRNKDYATSMLAKLSGAGFQGIIVETKVKIEEAEDKDPTNPNLKSITEIAAEVWTGRCSDERWDTWGSGHTRRERLEAAGYDYYAVQREIEKLYR